MNRVQLLDMIGKEFDKRFPVIVGPEEDVTAQVRPLGRIGRLLEAFDESKVRRGKTTDKSNAGSFAPSNAIRHGIQKLCDEIKVPCEEDPEVGVVTKMFRKVQGAWMKVVHSLRRELGDLEAGNDKGVHWVNTATSPEELAKDAKALEPAFRALVQGSAFEADAEPNYGPKKADGSDWCLKSLKRLREKAEARDPTQISDSIRGTIVADDPKQIPKVIEALRARAHAQGGVMRVDNKFKNANPWKNPYRAVHVDVKIPVPGTNRYVIAEIQVHLRAFHDGTEDSPKETGHKIYEKMRTGTVDEKKARVASQLIVAQAYSQALTVAKRKGRARMR